MWWHIGWGIVFVLLLWWFALVTFMVGILAVRLARIERVVVGYGLARQAQRSDYQPSPMRGGPP